jgi:hypothetical protein
VYWARAILTLSRLLAPLGEPGNGAVLGEAVMRQAGARLRAANRGHRRRPLTLDFNGLGIDVAGHPAGSSYNGHLCGRVYYPLVASIADTGDLIGARLRPGNAHPGDEAWDSNPKIVDAARRELSQVGLVRFDAGFTDDTTRSALEARDISYLGRLKSNPVVDRMAAPHLPHCQDNCHLVGY